MVKRISLYLTKCSTYIILDNSSYKDGERIADIIGSVRQEHKAIVQMMDSGYEGLIHNPPRVREFLVRADSGRVQHISSELLTILNIDPAILFGELTEPELAKEIHRNIQRI